MKSDLNKNLLAFSLLITQSELYAYALKTDVHNKFSLILNDYLKSSDEMIKYINQFIDENTLQDESEQIATFIENLIKNH